MQIELSLTDAEQKAILHYHETVEELVQTMVKNKAYTYMEQIAKENRNMDLEAVVNALPIKTKVEIEAFLSFFNLSDSLTAPATASKISPISPPALSA